MTARVEYELTCDGAPGMGPFDCSTAPLFHKTVKDAREEAARQGWVWGYRDGKRVDLCPDHQRGFTPWKRRRGTCTACGKERALTVIGDVVMKHVGKKLPGRRFAEWCPGSHKPPVEAQMAMACLTPDDPTLPDDGGQ